MLSVGTDTHERIHYVEIQDEKENRLWLAKICASSLSDLIVLRFIIFLKCNVFIASTMYTAKLLFSRKYFSGIW